MPQQPTGTRILCDRVVSPDREDRVGPHVIDVDGDRITRVTARAQAPADPGRTIVDLSGFTVLPGLIDAHTHLCLDVLLGSEFAQVQTSDSVLALRAASRGIVNLRAGVTTLRLTSEKNFTDIAVREMFVQGTFPGPRLLTACRGLKPTGGHGVTAVIADGPDEVRRALRENFLRGADHAKLFLTGGVATAGSDPLRSLYTQEEVNAAVEIAHNIGKPIGAHAYGGPGVDYCIAAGMDAIEHGVYVTDEQFARMAEVGCYLVATLGIFLMQPGPAENPSWPADVREKFLRAREAAAESVVRAKKNGVKVALGTDAIHGGAADEIIFAGASGLSNRDAIAGATTVAASLLRRENELGTVRDGAFADLIAVRGDPVKDLRALKQVEFVMASGLPVAA